MASLVRIPAHLRAVAAAHVAFELMDRRRLRSAHDVERNGLVGVAAEAPDLQIAVTGIERVTERRRGLRGAFEAKHALIPGLAGEPVGFLARLGCPLCCRPDRCAV